MYALDGRDNQIPELDIQRRNAIALALQNWGLIRVLTPEMLADENCSMDRIRIISHKDKKSWTRKTMYKMGVK